mmetsp:Transcript_52474/g.105159  ORF Transcript_52474/g.105159 Transcript_52474/m.105159 type:complete len:93 (+) Transcript_52474:797-1075(+)
MSYGSAKTFFRMISGKLFPASSFIRRKKETRSFKTSQVTTAVEAKYMSPPMVRLYPIVRASIEFWSTSTAKLKYAALGRCIVINFGFGKPYK